MAWGIRAHTLNGWKVFEALGVETLQRLAIREIDM
jgi:hypothetical protein